MVCRKGNRTRMEMKREILSPAYTTHWKELPATRL
ncbi:DUF4113 domain-containing protein [Escherichia coli]|nr:DUF4113 domain-containing protein [Escherichia coli]